MRTRRRQGGGRLGSALVSVSVVAATLGSLAFLMASSVLRAEREERQARAELRASYAAEAGLARARARLASGTDGAVASAAAPARVGGCDYWVTATPREDGLLSLVATGRDGPTTRRHELVVRLGRRAVDSFAAFGEQRLTLRKSCLVDSYDTARGSYASQVHADHAGEHGNVGSNADVEVAELVRVYGFAQHGRDEGDRILLTPGASLWQGFGAALREPELAPVQVPSHPARGELELGAGREETLGPGALQLAGLTLRRHAELTVRGPCELVVAGDVDVQPAATWTLDASLGHVRVYVTGDFRLESDATIRTPSDDPASVSILLAGVHESRSDPSPRIILASDARFHGTIHAPRLALRLGNAFELFGSLEARWLEVGSGARIHFDRALASDPLDAGAGLALVAWRALGPRPEDR